MRFARFAVFSLLLFSIPVISAQELRLLSGVSDYQVLQRGPDGSADIKLTGNMVGKHTKNKAVEARLSSNNVPVPGFDWHTIAKVVKGQWTGELNKIPTGGPYRLEVRGQGLGTVIPVENILVGDLWVLAGQSNMEGVGNLVEVQPPVPQIHSFDMSDRWLIAEEPLHTLVSAADPVHWHPNAAGEPERLTGEALQRYIADRRKGAGLGLPFAAEMYRRTGVPVGLIPCAHGGTSMDQWSPTLKDRGGESLYGSMLRRFKAVGSHVRGVLWYQGESDAIPQSAGPFAGKFVDFVNAVRTDFDDRNLPFYYVQIGRHVSNSNAAEWNAVQVAQLADEAQIAHSGMVVSVDLDLDDPIHISTRGHMRLAQRLANRVSHDLFPRVQNFAELKTGPRPVSARYDLTGLIRVGFTGVNGQLQSEGRISGFSLVDAKGQPVPMIYKARVDPAEASTVLLYVSGKPPENARLWYGAGKDPYCNLHDAADMAVPVFSAPVQ